jgi:uncharacterized membrane protein YbhN (UPF0104 family)
VSQVAGEHARDWRAPTPPSASRRRLLLYGGLALAVGLVLYFSLPQLAGMKRTLHVLRQADPIWAGAAIGLTVGSFFCYVLLVGGVVGGRFISGARRFSWSTAYEVGMASLAATTLLTAGGAGGIALMLWVLHQAGLTMRQAARRLATFLVFLYAVYMAALIVGGIVLRTGVTRDPAPLGLTVVPAALAGAVVCTFLLLSFMPVGFERRPFGRDSRRDPPPWLRRLRSVPALLAESTRSAIDLVRDRRHGPRAIACATGYWAFNLGALWALFRGFGETVPPLVLMQAFFVGMTASLIPLLPGGVGSIDGGLIAAFVAFGTPAPETVLAVLSYRLIAFWVPTVPEVVAYIRLQRRMSHHGEGLRLVAPS